MFLEMLAYRPLCMSTNRDTDSVDPRKVEFTHGYRSLFASEYLITMCKFLFPRLHGLDHALCLWSTVRKILQLE